MILSLNCSAKEAFELTKIDLHFYLNHQSEVKFLVSFQLYFFYWKIVPSELLIMTTQFFAKIKKPVSFLKIYLLLFIRTIVLLAWKFAPLISPWLTLSHASLPLLETTS